ncbi:MAG: sigma-54 dependent transcriptional regulator [Acidobacteriota bacterium]
MTRSTHTILVIDDEPAYRQFLTAVLKNAYTVITASDGKEAGQLLEKRHFDLIITDDHMPKMTGLDLIEWARAQAIATPIIVLTAYGAIETAVRAIKLGAQDYLTKPLKNPEQLRLLAAKLIRENEGADKDFAEGKAFKSEDLIVRSEQLKEVFRLAAKVAPLPTSVLLTGDSGTGKDVVAHYIHHQSPRLQAPFIAINCAALPETLLESELFGYEKGAFTDARQSKQGLFELASGGTLFLDEIGEMNLPLQAKLLRALEEQQIKRLGSTRYLNVDVRLIAATNKDLEQAIEEGTFRRDLYYRLNVFPLWLAPLRERLADILPLAELFLAKIAGRAGQPPKPLSRETQELLLSYDWPGNVRELKNVMERVMIVATQQSIEPADLPLQILNSVSTLAVSKTLADIERTAILETLSQTDWNRSAAADRLNISLRTLQYRLKEYGLTGKGKPPE